MARPTLRTPGSGSVSWLPVPGREPVCRLAGCRSPATDDTLRLCVVHEDVYRAQAARTLVSAGRELQALRTMPR
ncbi:MAG: hypothetical protein ACYCTE_03890 [Acidimicrobiales bacterium]